MQENPHLDMDMPKCGYRSITIKKKNQWISIMIGQLRILLKVGNKFCFTFLQFPHLTFMFLKSDLTGMN